MSEWQELHNEPKDDGSAFDVVTVEIEFGNTVIYECEVEVETYHDLPCKASVLEMTRCYYPSEHDYDVTKTDLKAEEFPHYIKLAAEKKALGY